MPDNRIIDLAMSVASDVARMQRVDASIAAQLSRAISEKLELRAMLVRSFRLLDDADAMIGDLITKLERAYDVR